MSNTSMSSMQAEILKKGLTPCLTFGNTVPLAIAGLSVAAAHTISASSSHQSVASFLHTAWTQINAHLTFLDPLPASDPEALIAFIFARLASIVSLYNSLPICARPLRLVLHSMTKMHVSAEEGEAIYLTVLNKELVAYALEGREITLQEVTVGDKLQNNRLLREWFLASHEESESEDEEEEEEGAPRLRATNVVKYRGRGRRYRSWKSIPKRRS